MALRAEAASRLKVDFSTTLESGVSGEPERREKSPEASSPVCPLAPAAATGKSASRTHVPATVPADFAGKALSVLGPTHWPREGWFAPNYRAWLPTVVTTSLAPVPNVVMWRVWWEILRRSFAPLLANLSLFLEFPCILVWK